MSSGINWHTSIALNEHCSYSIGKAWATGEAPHEVIGGHYGLREDLPDVLPQGVDRERYQTLEEVMKRANALKAERQKEYANSPKHQWLLEWSDILYSVTGSLQMAARVLEKTK
jgi:hypothetical protein